MSMILLAIAHAVLDVYGHTVESAVASHIQYWRVLHDDPKNSHRISVKPRSYAIYYAYYIHLLCRILHLYVHCSVYRH